MTKKSNRTAERYATLSKQGKKKLQPKHHHQIKTAPTTTYPETAKPEVSASPVSQTASKRRSEMIALSRQHVVSDLKTIGIIGGAIVVVLIILAFVLG
ncbi:hypothetical protein ACFLTS_03295 [Chloroflexota bacterium]